MCKLNWMDIWKRITKIILDRILLCSPSKLRDLPSSVSWALRLKACVTTPSLQNVFKILLRLKEKKNLGDKRKRKKIKKKRKMLLKIGEWIICMELGECQFEPVNSGSFDYLRSIGQVSEANQFTLVISFFEYQGPLLATFSFAVWGLGNFSQLRLGRCYPFKWLY